MENYKINKKIKAMTSGGLESNVILSNSHTSGVNVSKHLLRQHTIAQFWENVPVIQSMTGKLKYDNYTTDYSKLNGIDSQYSICAYSG